MVALSRGSTPNPTPQATRSSVVLGPFPRPHPTPREACIVQIPECNKLGSLLVSTTSYSQHAVSTIQSPISTANNGTVLNRHRRANHSPPGLRLHFPSFLNAVAHILEYKNILYLTSNRKLLDFYRILFSMARLSTYTD